MSEQKTSFMADLDQWSEANVVGPLLNAGPNQDNLEATVELVKKAIRAKVLESYRNGQAAGPRKAYPQRRPHGL